LILLLFYLLDAITLIFYLGTLLPFDFIDPLPFGRDYASIYRSLSLGCNYPSILLIFYLLDAITLLFIDLYLWDVITLRFYWSFTFWTRLHFYLLILFRFYWSFTFWTRLHFDFVDFLPLRYDLIAILPLECDYPSIWLFFMMFYASLLLLNVHCKIIIINFVFS
jgi:hypothetical protein